MNETPIKDRELERNGRRFGHSARWFLLVAAILVVPGVVLVLIGHGWTLEVGAAVLLLASIPGAVGLGLLLSAAFARWSARHKSFA